MRRPFVSIVKTTRLAVLIMTACTHANSAGFQVRIEMDAGETLGVLSYRSGVTRHGSMVRPGKHMKYYEPRTRVSSLARFTWVLVKCVPRWLSFQTVSLMASIFSLSAVINFSSCELEQNSLYSVLQKKVSIILYWQFSLPGELI